MNQAKINTPVREKELNSAHIYLPIHCSQIEIYHVYYYSIQVTTDIMMQMRGKLENYQKIDFKFKLNFIKHICKLRFVFIYKLSRV